MSKVTEADLNALYDIANIYLTDIASRYSKAAKSVDSIASSGDSGIFYLPGTSYNSERSSAYENWADLRNDLQTILADTCNNTLATAKLLVKIMEAYRDQDEENAGGIASAGLEQHIKDRKGHRYHHDHPIEPDDVDAPPEPHEDTITKRESSKGR